MNRLDKLEHAISELDDDELKQLGSWIDELRWQRWDRQFEADVKAGRLDRFVSEARAEIAAGKTKSL